MRCTDRLSACDEHHEIICEATSADFPDYRADQQKEKNSEMLIHILSHIVEFRNGESGSHVLHIHKLTEMLLERVADFVVSNFLIILLLFSSVSMS